MTNYNQPQRQERYPTVGDKHYRSRLFKEVPRTKIPIDSPEFNLSNCWHCQENPRLQTTFGLVVWCKRCYDLHGVKPDGTKVEPSTIPIGKDLVDLQQGKVKVKDEQKVDKKVYNDD